MADSHSPSNQELTAISFTQEELKMIIAMISRKEWFMDDFARMIPIYQKVLPHVKQEPSNPPITNTPDGAKTK